MLTVYSGGSFDLFHCGHVNLLRYCKHLAGITGKVIVGLNTDQFIEKYKGNPPIMNYKERESCLLACKYVDEVIPNIGGIDSKKTIKKIKDKIDIIVIGSDWLEKDYLKQMSFTWDWLMKMKIGICYFPYTQNISTTQIKKRLNETSNSNSNNSK